MLICYESLRYKFFFVNCKFVIDFCYKGFEVYFMWLVDNLVSVAIEGLVGDGAD